jgi:hypothetical protein
MECLTRPECVDYAWKVRLDSDDLLGRRRRAAGRKRAAILDSKHTATFIYESLLKQSAAVCQLLTECLGDFTWAVLWAYELPFGDRSTEAEPPGGWGRYASWRQAAGESRRLYDAPGHLFAAGERSAVAEALVFAIRLGWDAVLFGSPPRAVIRLSHDDDIDIMARSAKEISRVTDALVRLGLSKSKFARRMG